MHFSISCLLHCSKKPPYFACGSGSKGRRKDETHVVTCYSLFPKLEAIWARRAGTFPVERPRIGRHWNYPQRHFPYRQGAIAPGLIGLLAIAFVAAPSSKRALLFLQPLTSLAIASRIIASSALLIIWNRLSSGQPRNSSGSL